MATTLPKQNEQFALTRDKFGHKLVQSNQVYANGKNRVVSEVPKVVKAGRTYSLSVTGDTGDKYKLTITPVLPGQSAHTTAFIAFNAAPSAIAAALAAATGVDVRAFAVTANSIELTQWYSQDESPTLSLDATGMTSGGSSAAVAQTADPELTMIVPTTDGGRYLESEVTLV